MYIRRFVNRFFVVFLAISVGQVAKGSNASLSSNDSFRATTSDATSSTFGLSTSSSMTSVPQQPLNFYQVTRPSEFSDPSTTMLSTSSSSVAATSTSMVTPNQQQEVSDDSKESSDEEKVDQEEIVVSQDDVKESAIAYYNLGIDHLNENKPELAVRCFEQAAELGDVDALFELGQCYEDGIGVDESDDKKAAEYYKKASDNGDANAQCALAGFYIEERGGLMMNEPREKRLYEAKWLYEEAAINKNHPEALLGLYYGCQTGLWNKKDVDPYINIKKDDVKKAFNAHGVGDDLYKKRFKTLGRKRFGNLMKIEIKIDEEICSICLAKFQQGNKIAVFRQENSACKHIFHPKCIRVWLKVQNTCPNCRKVGWVYYRRCVDEKH